MTPTDVLNRPAWQFWMDADIRRAGQQWENDQRERDGDAGAATKGEQKDLVEDQERRADRREAMDGQPDLAEQLNAIDDGGTLNDA